MQSRHVDQSLIFTTCDFVLIVSVTVTRQGYCACTLRPTTTIIIQLMNLRGHCPHFKHDFQEAKNLKPSNDQEK